MCQERAGNPRGQAIEKGNPHDRGARASSLQGQKAKSFGVFFSLFQHKQESIAGFSVKAREIAEDTGPKCCPFWALFPTGCIGEKRRCQGEVLWKGCLARPFPPFPICGSIEFLAGHAVKLLSSCFRRATSGAGASRRGG